MPKCIAGRLSYRPVHTFLAVVFALGASATAQAAEPFTLAQLEGLARSGNPSLRTAEAEVGGARAAINTARAFPNPEVEYITGSLIYRSRPNVSGVSGSATSVSVTQPLDLPFRRAPRIAAAEAGLEAAQAGYAAYEADWIAQLRLAYFDVLRRRAEKVAADQDLALMQRVYSRISLKVNQGDAPRLELIRAEADLLGVQKTAQAAQLRQEQARLQLRAMVGPDLPDDYSLTGQLDAALPLAPADQLIEQAIQSNPTLARARAEAAQAREQVAFEKAGRLPNIALRAVRETDQEMRQNRVGVTVTVPLWDRKNGPVREAEARHRQSDFRVQAETFAVRQRIEIALRLYRVAQSQVAALENGLVAQTKSAVDVAQVAYKTGERALIDLLDAQRVWRAARADLNTSRYELAAAWVEIQRVIALPADTTLRSDR